MPLSEPGWWYGDEGRMWATVLSPVSRIYGRIAARRMENAQPYTSRLPVICVGNFTAGGTGKTPMSLLLADLVREMGEVPAFLTRGYGGTLRGPHLVDLKKDDASRTGDEPLLLARSAMTMIARNRVAGARALEHMTEPPTVIIMDDGLQNPALAKTLKLALIDGVRGVGNGQVIPSGPLRAPLATQLRLVDAVIANGGTASIGRNAPPSDTAYRTATRLLQTARFQRPFFKAWITPRCRAVDLPDKPVLAFAGIGNPQAFFDTLRQSGIEIARTIIFRDHHMFDVGNAEYLLALADELDAPLITTEKDFVRLQGYRDQRAELARRVIALPIKIQFQGDELEALKELIRFALSPDDAFSDTISQAS